MKTSSCKAKGRELQKFVAEKIRQVFNLPEEDVVSQCMGSPGKDIRLSERALSLLPLSIECKNTKIHPSVAALDQARHNSKPSETPCVVWKPPRKGYQESLVYLNLEDFLILLKTSRELQINKSISAALNLHTEEWAKVNKGNK